MFLVASSMALTSDEQKYPVAIWLVPAPEQQRQIQEIISDLAAKHSRGKQYFPVFQPHMTLCDGNLKKENVEKRLPELFAKIKSFADGQKETSLAVQDPVRKKKWSRFLILPLDLSDRGSNELPQEASNQVKDVFDATPCEIARDDGTPIPHISLMYSGIEDPLSGTPQQGTTDGDNFSHIIQEVSNNYNLNKQVVFQSIQVVTPISGDWRDILKEHPNANGTWKILKIFRLKPVEPPKPLRTVIAGGQTGVDQAAWRAARLEGILIGGWCPPRLDIGNGNTVPAEFSCQETPFERSSTASDVPRSQRTIWNVRDSDAVLILRGLNSDQACIQTKPPDTDAGTGLTIDFAKKFQKQFKICDPSKAEGVEDVAKWIQGGQIQGGKKIRTLDIAGPSEAQEPGVGSTAEQFLLKVFALLRKPVT